MSSDPLAGGKPGLRAADGFGPMLALRAVMFLFDVAQNARRRRLLMFLFDDGQSMRRRRLFHEPTGGNVATEVCRPLRRLSLRTP